MNCALYSNNILITIQLWNISAILWDYNESSLHRLIDYSHSYELSLLIRYQAGRSRTNLVYYIYIPSRALFGAVNLFISQTMWFAVLIIVIETSWSLM